MATTTAKTKQDVDSMSKRERLWDSLNYDYGKKADLINQEFDKASSQQNQQALKVGMQRSSYNNQIQANLNKQKIDALNDNQSAFIADYENRIGDLEQQEAEAERWEREFAANREDTAWNQAFQTSQFEEQKANNAWEQGFKDRELDAQLAQWDKQFEYTKMSDEQKIAYTTATTMLQQHIMPSDALLAAAGISKEDAQAMVQGKASNGGGYYGGAGNGNGNNNTNNLNGQGGSNANKAKPTDASFYVDLDKDLQNIVELYSTNTANGADVVRRVNNTISSKKTTK